MAIKTNESDEKMVKEFFSDVKRGSEDKKAARTVSYKDEAPRSVIAKVGEEGDFRIGYRRTRFDSNIAKDVQDAWKNIIEKSTQNILKKFDALGFSMDKVEGKEVELTLSLPQ